MESINTINTGEGNTKPLPKSMKKVSFTINNPPNTLIHDIIQTCTERGYFYVIGEEVGESGTPHLQGYIEFGSAKAFSTVKKLLPRAHIERSRGDREQNRTYCKKGGKFFENFPLTMQETVLKEYDDVEWYDFQKMIIEMYDTEPCKRTIHWITDYVGNNGKSFLTRYMVVKYNVLLVNGKKADVFHQIAKRFEPEKENPFKMVIMDIPRHQAEFVNYGLLEEIKNGIIMSGKYEGGTFVFPIPHVIVLSNALPDYSKFSADRWNTIVL